MDPDNTATTSTSPSPAPWRNTIGPAVRNARSTSLGMNIEKDATDLMTRIEQTVGMPYQDAVAYFEVIAALVDEHPAAADDMAVKPVVDIRCNSPAT